MKKSDFKKLVKPIVKECIQETLLEGGLLSQLIKEIAKGAVNAQLLAERRMPQPRMQETIQEAATEEFEQENWLAPRKRKPVDTGHVKKKLMNAIGADAYGGVNIFEGTEPLRSGGQPGATGGGISPGATPDDPSVKSSNSLARNGISPDDPGLDISFLSGIMGRR